jgi:alpha-amylase
VSFDLGTHLGTSDEFDQMATDCNAAGVHIIADIVINHMANRAGTGSNGGTYDGQLYPRVPFGDRDFHQYGEINDYNDRFQVERFQLVGLEDLDTSKLYVQDTIVAYLDDLVVRGVKGFRVDAASHIHKDELNSILVAVQDIPGTTERPVVYLEAMSQSYMNVVNEYGWVGRLVDFRYSYSLNSNIENNAASLLYVETHSGVVPGSNSIAYITNHDSQRSPHTENSNYCRMRASLHCKDSGSGFRNNLAVAFVLMYPHGLPRIMSGFYFDHHDQNPPRSGTDIRPATEAATSNCLTSNGWDCRHRSPHVYPLVAARNEAGNEPIQHKHTRNHMQISWSLGTKVFVAINAANSVQNNFDENWDQWVQTSLPSGNYCNTIYSALNSQKTECVDRTDITRPLNVPSTVNVNQDQWLRIEIPYDAPSRVMVLYVGQRIVQTMTHSEM